MNEAYIGRLFPPVPPRPVPGCRECGKWAEERAAALRAGDRSAVSDMNVLIREHQRRAHR